MDWKDPAWWSLIVSLIALVISLPSAALAWKSLQWERDSAESSRRSAEAAERANLLTERALDRQTELVSNLDPALLERFESQSLRASADATAGVSWQVEQKSGNRYVLRNIGSAIAEHVSADPKQFGGLSRSLPSDAVVRPGEGVDFLVLSAWGRPMPNQLYLKWGDMQNYVAVPMP